MLWLPQNVAALSAEPLVCESLVTVYTSVCVLLQVPEEQTTPGAYQVSVTLPKLQTSVTEFEADPDTDLFQVRQRGMGEEC